MTDLGSAYGSIVLDTSGVDRAVLQAQLSFQNGLQRIGVMVEGLADHMHRLGASLTLLTAPLAGFGATGIKVAASFEGAMKQIESFGGVAGAELEKVRQFVLKMGADTVFSAQDAGNAMLDLLKSGMNVKQAMETLPQVLNLATVGNLSLAEASGVVTSGLAQFGIKAADAGRVTEALARAANASRADVRDLGQALGNVGPVARQYGLTVEDVSAILATFANNGIMGAEAGTQLRSMLLNISRPTKSVSEAWKQLGVSLYDNQGNIRNLNTVIMDMDKALDKLPVQQQNELMQKLGGTYGIVGLNALRASNGFGAMAKAMKDAPSTGKIVQDQASTFNRAVESLRGSIETLQITVLTPFMETVLKPLVNRLIEITNKVTAWAKENPQLVSTIVAIGAALVTIGPVLLTMSKFISGFGALIAMAGTFASGPLALVIAGVVALGLAWKNNIGNIRFIVMPVLINIQKVLEAVGGGVKEFFDTLSAGGDVFTGLKSGFEVFLRLLDRLFATSNTGPTDAMSEFGQVLGDTFEIMRTGGQVIEGDVLPAFENVRRIFSAMVNAFVSGWQNVVEFVQQRVLPALQRLGRWFTQDVVPAIIGIIRTLVIPTIVSLLQFLGDVWNIVGPALTRLAEWFLGDGLFAIQEFISGTVLPLIYDFIRALSNLWEDIKPGLLSFVDWFINEGLPSVINFIQNVVLPALNELGRWFTQDVLPAVVNFIQTTVLPAVQRFVDFLGRIWAIAGPALEDLARWFLETALPAIQAFISDVVIPGIEDFITLLIDIWDRVSPSLEDLFNWFVNEGIPAIVQAVEDFHDDILQPIITTLKNLWNAIKPGLESLYNWFITTGWPTIKNTVEHFWKEILEPLIKRLSEFWELNVRPALDNFLNWVNMNMPKIQKLWEDTIGTIIRKAEEFFQTVNRIIDEVGRLTGLSPEVKQNRMVPAFGTPEPEWQLRREVSNANTNIPRGTAKSSFRQFGGDVIKGLLYRVNERGGEFFKSNEDGQVIPLSELSGQRGGVGQPILQMPITIQSMGKLVDEQDILAVRQELRMMGETVIAALKGAAIKQRGSAS